MELSEPLSKMDPFIEVVFAEDSENIFRDRFELPLFFIVGGADDLYLSNLIGQPILPLVLSKSVDIPTETPFGVYASRALLSAFHVDTDVPHQPATGYARTFPLSFFLNEKWPTLDSLTSNDPKNRSESAPSNVQKVWIIRALRRAGLNDLAESIKIDMLRKIYPQKLSVSFEFNPNNLANIYLMLSEEQREYPMVIIVDDLPIQLGQTIGDFLQGILLTGCTNSSLQAIKTSLDLLQLS